MSAEFIRTRLFKPFERLGAQHSGVEGSGLGLALARQLVLAMQWGEAYPSGVFIFLATVLCAYLVAAVVLFQFFKVQTQALQMAYDAGQNN